jgi:hypothetical protein
MVHIPIRDRLTEYFIDWGLDGEAGDRNRIRVKSLETNMTRAGQSP